MQPESRVRSTYDVVAEDYAATIRGTGGEQPLDIAMIAHFAGLLGGERRVLDAGCGAGRLLPVLAGMGCSPQGVDLSPGMVACARRDHPQFAVQVASLAALPFADGTFDGVMSWYSTIHTPDDALPAVLAELRRVVRPRGLVLLGFQAGHGIHDSGATYRARGHDVELVRYNRTADEMAAHLSTAHLVEVARVVRAPVGGQKDDQAMMLARRP